MNFLFLMKIQGFYLFILIMKIQVSTHLVLTKYYQMKKIQNKCFLMLVRLDSCTLRLFNLIN